LSQLGGIAAEPVDPMPTSELSGLLRDLDDDTVSSLLSVAGAQIDSPLAVVQIRHLGGALAGASVDDGPSGAISEPYQLFCLGVPMTPELGSAIEVAFAQVRTAMGNHLSGRTFFNFLGDDDDPARAFSTTALARLGDVKRLSDPKGVFRSNRPLLVRTQP
jgi:hypothetical protein